VVHLANVKFIEDITYSGRMSRGWMPSVGQGYELDLVPTDYGEFVRIIASGYPPLYIPRDKVLHFHVAPEAK